MDRVVDLERDADASGLGVQAAPDLSAAVLSLLIRLGPGVVLR